MKALYCHDCHDVIAVPPEYRPRHCTCGKSWVEPLDSIHVRYDGPATILGLFNEDLAPAKGESERLETNWPLRIHAIPPGDGVLRPDQHCDRCPPGGSEEDARRAHGVGDDTTVVKNFAAPADKVVEQYLDRLASKDISAVVIKEAVAAWARRRDAGA